MKKIVSSRGFKLAALGAALAVSGAAIAVEAGAPQRTQEGAYRVVQDAGQYGHHRFHHAGPHASSQHGKGMYRHGHSRMDRAGLVVPGYGAVSQDFIDGMGLDETQLKRIEEARQAAKDLREKRREHMKAMRDAKVDRFKDGAFDPEQALKERIEQRENAVAERTEVDRKWLAAWQSLDAGQQARVADHLKQRAEARAERRKARRNAESRS